jgi:Fe2+ or Zn2+ uptake regulation protein
LSTGKKSAKIPKKKLDTGKNHAILFVMIPNRSKKSQGVIRRASSQREIVLDAICQGNHLSAREIFEAVGRIKPMSFGTVYRNLQILVEEGEIICVATDTGAFRYDRRRDRHHHLHCKKCGKVFDVPLAYRGAVDREAAKKSGFVIDSHTISFEGLCTTCAADEGGVAGSPRRGGQPKTP